MKERFGYQGEIEGVLPVLWRPDEAAPTSQ